MLKDDLERIIKENGYEIFERESGISYLNERQVNIKVLAQAIIDRLEIDEERLVQIIWEYTSDSKERCRGLVEWIKRARIIKLKESDK